ncbi:acyl-CoA dehydrogenase [Geothermobacter ehrlichii]|uniref:Acyl-CoA dehydrogenase n=1 Tax=Geothermobacter ehrlichii TaxID=213224 RepID=A0A5D3WHQ9_9BACT|nr:acyl-CoA dehydrogenase family protein [Geothermobacter ehrlichii]TYO98405.1 acyl-CoA dehydrogenase [Geothermobacter ehrlichii]
MVRDEETLNVMLETVSRFVKEQLIPIEEDVSRTDAIPDEIVDQMRELGLFGLSIPEDYGGLGLTLEEEVNVIFELCHASPVFRSMIGTNVGIGSLGIVIAGTEEQKQKYLPKLASGEIIASFALTEPDAGSDAASLRTTARRDGNSYVINGVKRFITNAPEAGLFTVFARTNAEEKGARGVSALLVERDTPGVSLGKNEKKMGQQGGHVCDVIFDDCRVPASCLLGKEGTGFKTAMKILDKSRTHIASVCVGAAERIIEESVRYAAERKQFGKVIGEFQLIQAMLADSKAEAYAARCMVLDAARKYDEGKKITTESSCCKLFASEMVCRVADRGVQIHGGYGYTHEYAVERFYRDMRLFRVFEGTSQIQQLIIARNMLKEL